MIFLSFGAVVIVIALLGVHFNSREAMGGAGRIGIGFLVAGAIFAAGGLLVGRSGRDNSAPRA